MPLSYEEFRKKFNEGQKRLESHQSKYHSGGYKTIPSSSGSNDLPPIPGVAGKYDVMRHTMMTSQPVSLPKPGDPDFIGPVKSHVAPWTGAHADESAVPMDAPRPGDPDFIGPVLSKKTDSKTTSKPPEALDNFFGGLKKGGEWIDKNLPWLSKASDALWQADQAVSDFKAGALDTATLGATQGIGRATLDNMKKADPSQADKLDQAFKDRTDSTSYKVGGFAGYIAPGTAIDKAVVKVGGKALEKLAPVAQGLIRGAAAGTLDSASQEAGDVAFREGKFDPLNVAIGTGLGGALGAAIPAVTPYIGKGIRRFVGSVGNRATNKEAQAIVDDAVEALNLDKAAQTAVPNVDSAIPTPDVNVNTPSLPSTVSRMPHATATSAVRLTGTLDDALSGQPPATPGGLLENFRRIRDGGNPSSAVHEQAPAVHPIEPPVQGASDVAPNVGSTNSALQAMESDLLAKTSYSTDDIYHAGRLVRQLQDTAGKTADQVATDSKRAATLVDTLSSQLTKSGQSIEAANVWHMLSPDSYVIALERNLERVNRLRHGDNASRYVQMTPEEVTSAHGIADLAQRVGVHASEARQIGIMLRLKSNMGGNLNPEESSMVRGFLNNMEDLKRGGYFSGLRDAQVQRYQAAMDRFIAGDPSLTPRNIDFLRSTSLKISRLAERERKLALQDMQAIKNGQDELEFKLGRKLATMQYLSMLYNVPSQLRNIIGNTTLYAFDRLSHTISLPFDMLRSKLTGRARQIYFTTGEGVAETFFDGLTTAVPVLSRDWREGLALGAKAGWNGVNPEGLSSKYEIGGFAFSGKGKWNIGGKTMRFLEKTLGATMKGFDHAQYNRAYQTRLQESAYARALEVAKDIGKAGDKEFIRQHTEMLMHNVDNYINQVSKQYGQYVTLQDDSLLARLLTGFRRGTNKLSTLGASSEYGLGSIIMPFAKVPANLVMRAIDYSPIGVARSAMNLRKVKAEYDRVLKEIADHPNTHDVAKRNLATTKLSDADWSLGMSVGRAIMGTSLGALTWHFASKGLIWGSSSGDQKTREFDQAQGKGAFQINISGVLRAVDHMFGGGSVDDDVKSVDGDLLVAYDWLQPLSFPIAMGSTIYTQGNDPTTKRDVGARVVDGASTAFDTLFQSSPLRGLKDMFKTSYGEDSFSQQLVRNLATTGITQLVPSAARQLKQTMDNKFYETYDPNLKTSILNRAKVNIPFINTNLPESVTTMGTKIPRDRNELALLNPFRATSYSTDDNIKFLADLFNDTGNTEVLPNVASKTVSVNTPSGPQSIKLSAVEWTKLQEMMGNEMIRRLGMINPNLPIDQREYAVKNIISGVGTFARNTLIHDKRQKEPDRFNDLNINK